MAVVISTDCEGYINFLRETTEDITFICKTKEEKRPYTIIYKSNDKIEKIIEPLKNYETENKKISFYSIPGDKIKSFMKRRGIKILCNVEPIEISEAACNCLFPKKKTLKTKNEILEYIINESIFPDGLLADLYYATYGDIHIFDSTNKKTWYNFNEYGIYEQYDGDNILIWNNIKFRLSVEIIKYFDDSIENNSSMLKHLDGYIRDITEKKIKTTKKLRTTVITFINTESKMSSTIKYLANTYYGKHNISQIMDTIKYNCIGFNNGVYDLDTGIFRKGKKEELISLTTGYNYSPENKQYLDYVMKLLSSMIPNEEELTYILKKSSLFLVHGLPLREFYSIVGSGANGKGVYSLLLKRMLGKYCGSIKPSYFDKSIKKKDANSADPQLAKNRLCRLVICDEIESCFEIDSAKVRAMTSGNTEISGRFLYGQDIDFYAGFKLLFISNYALSFDMSAKHGDRYEQIKSFRYEFVDNPIEEYQKKIDHNLNDKINKDHNYALAMFHILVKYYNIYAKIEKYNIPRPQIMEEERNMLKIENDPVGAFMNEYTEKTNNYQDKVIGNQLFTAFIDYNKGGNMRIQRPEFYQQLSNKHYEIKDFHKQKVIRGIKLKKIEKIEDNDN